MDVQKLDEIVAAVGRRPFDAHVGLVRGQPRRAALDARRGAPGAARLPRAGRGADRRPRADGRAGPPGGRADHRVGARPARLPDLRHRGRPPLQNEADRILAEARQEAEEIRAEADDYVDSKLANFEVVLTKTLGSVGRGREKLLGTGPAPTSRATRTRTPPSASHDPETLRRDADAYVDVKLGAFEAVLAKTLEAVGKGRQKLHGRIASDDLGELGAFAEDGTPGHHTSDSDYLAGLAELSETPAARADP